MHDRRPNSRRAQGLNTERLVFVQKRFESWHTRGLLCYSCLATRSTKDPAYKVTPIPSRLALRGRAPPACSTSKLAKMNTRRGKRWRRRSPREALAPNNQAVDLTIPSARCFIFPADRLVSPERACSVAHHGLFCKTLFASTKIWRFFLRNVLRRRLTRVFV
jgi:hypothetical protein